MIEKPNHPMTVGLFCLVKIRIRLFLYVLKLSNTTNNYEKINLPIHWDRCLYYDFL